MDKKKVGNVLMTIGVIMVLASSIAEIIIVNFCGVTVTKIDLTIWVCNLIIWVGIWAEANRQAKSYKASYETVSNSYNQLSKQFDELLKTADDINKNSIKQNKLCDEVNKNNKELLQGWQKALDDCKRFHKDRHDLLLALAEYDPKHPLITKIIDEFEANRKKEAEENKSDVISE